MKRERSIHFMGWLFSVILHIFLFLLFSLIQTGSYSEDLITQLGGGGGSGTVFVQLVGGNQKGGPKGEPEVPREIRKFEEPISLPPPQPEDLPEPEPPPKRIQKKKKDSRPVVAPNKRRSRKKPRKNNGQGDSNETTISMGIGGGKGGGVGTGIGSGYGPGIGMSEFPYPSWIQAVRTKITANWKPMIAPVGPSQEFEAVVFCRISRKGILIEVKMVRSSGNALYDQSIVRALKLSDPFPPLPYQYQKPTVAFKLTFRYTP